MYCSLTYWQTFQSGLIFILTWKKYDFKTYDHLFDYYLHTQLDFVEIGYPLIKLPKISHSLKYTLYNTILRIARNLLETRENIKIESHSFYHIICDRFSWGSSKKKSKMANFQNGRFSKQLFFKIANSRNVFAKILQIGPWVSRID